MHRQMRRRMVAVLMRITGGEEGRGLPQNMWGLPSMRFAALETAKKEEKKRKK